MKPSLVILSSMLLMPLMALADTWTDPETGIEWAYTVSGGNADLYNSKNSVIPTSTIGSIVIPSKLGGYPVTSIGGYAFSGCSGLTNVTIPTEIKKIEDHAFRGCEGLTEIVVPKSVEHIGQAAFTGCINLTRVELPFVGSERDNTGCRESLFGYVFGRYVDPKTDEFVQNYNDEDYATTCLPQSLKEVVITDESLIAFGAFDGCSRLTSVNYLKTPTRIKRYAFRTCYGLSAVEIPSGVETIESGAFEGCGSIRSVSLPLNIKCAGAFMKCVSVTSVRMPTSQEGLADIFPDTFSSISKVEICDGETSICKAAFRECKGLSEVSIPNSVTNVGDEAFAYCYALRDVSVPFGVRTIGELSFAHCVNMTNVTLSASIENIGFSAFLYCENLSSVTIPACVTAMSSLTFAPEYSKIKTIELCEGRTVVESGLFDGCKGLLTVTIPQSVKKIESGAFSECTKLTKVAFPSGVEVTREKLREWGLSDAVLGDYVEGDYIIVNASLLGYVGTAYVEELVIPEGIELIDEYALAELEDLERVELPETVKYIGKGAFANDTYLHEVVQPDSVEVIGEGAFENCSWMQTMKMGAGVRSVGDRAFAGCTKLASAKFTDGLGEVGDAAFSNCWRMMSVSLPVSVSNVAATAFKDCASLMGVSVPTMIAPMSEWFAPVYRQIENVTVPEGTTEVRAEMFAGCASLKTVELPEGVTNIASGAFRDCVALETILLPESLESVGDEAFAGCAALKAIVLPKNVAVLGKRAFSGCAELSDVTLSRALTAIPDGTFAGCDALDSFVVPESVTELGSQIVPSATTAIYYLGNAPAYAADVYAQANAALVSYAVDGTKGWDGRPISRDIPQTWPTSNARTIRTWFPVKVDVTFVGNGGTFANPAGESCVCEQIVDTAYSLPPYEPVRKGYRFDGYWTEANGGTRVTSGVSVKQSSPHSLYSHWVVGRSVTVRFNAMGGAVEPESRAYVSEEPFGELPIPIRAHYQFAGWFTSSSGGTQVTVDSEVPTQDMELFSHWAQMQYAIRFHANDGTDAVVDQQFNFGSIVTLEKNGFVRAGYVFCGWATSADGAVVYADGASVQNLATDVNGIADLYAVWKLAEFPIAYENLGGATHDNPTSYQEGSSVEFTPPSIRTGYRFTGWSPSAILPEMSGPQTVVANWSANSYQIVYLPNGGSGSMSTADCVYDQEVVIAINGYSRSGYFFNGWAMTANGDVIYRPGEKVSNLTAVDGGVVKLYAVWGETESQEVLWPNWEKTETDCFLSVNDSTLRIDTTVEDGGRLSLYLEGSGTLTFLARGSEDGFYYCEKGGRGNYVRNSDSFAEYTYEVNGDGPHTILWITYAKGYLGTDAWGEIKDVRWRGKPLQYGGPDPAPASPTVVDDEYAVVTGDAETGFVVNPSDWTTAVEVSIPQGVDAAKVTVEVSTKVATVKPNGAKVKVVVGEDDITNYLVIPESDGVLNVAAATVKGEIVKETLDPSKDAVIELNAANPRLTTAPTRKGLTYTLYEGNELKSMSKGDSKLGDGDSWTPTITVLGGNAAFYSIGVSK